MEIIRTEKGTASEKDSGDTLTIPSVQMIRNEMLFLAVGAKCSYTIPVTGKCGDLEMDNHAHIANIPNGFNMDFYSICPESSGTFDLVATWGESIGARVMFALSASSSSVLHAPKVAPAVGPTTDPSSGQSAATTIADLIAIGAFVSNGPEEDTIGTIQNGYTSGQRVGTTGGADNITIHECFKIYDTSGVNLIAQKTGATSRNWIVAVAGWRIALDNRVAISPSDLFRVRRKFDNEVPPIPWPKMVFHYNRIDDIWEAYEVDLEANGTKVTDQNTGTGGWE